jgi:hypothetical protein
MIFSNVKIDLAKGAISALCFALLFEKKGAIAPPWIYAVYVIPVAFIVWLVFLVRASLRYKREREYAGFWSVWQRPIIAITGFLMPIIIFSM